MTSQPNLEDKQAGPETEQVEEKRLYSQAARQSVSGENTRITRKVDMSWADEVSTKLENIKETEFDKSE
ncbi:36923_t:CDS:2 [Gigaspora margarita]|uniref:36923_t:CDS:1 n=1 Tax=Gigaspora margarita TaxID=4874 RepID=A0ABN7VZF0_GIGMA|nr:36923_t:CDS:2 [Gigaspora margarita]